MVVAADAGIRAHEAAAIDPGWSRGGGAGGHLSVHAVLSLAGGQPQRQHVHEPARHGHAIHLMRCQVS